MSRRIRIARPPASVRPSDWTDYMREGRVSSALLLFMVVVGLAWWKRGRVWPTQQRMVALAAGAFMVAWLASYQPDFVTWLMIALLVVFALENQDAVIDLLRRWQANLAGAGAGYRGAVRPV